MIHHKSQFYLLSSTCALLLLWFTLTDLKDEFTLEAAGFFSNLRNTPFHHEEHLNKSLGVYRIHERHKDMSYSKEIMDMLKRYAEQTRLDKGM